MVVTILLTLMQYINKILSIKYLLTMLLLCFYSVNHLRFINHHLATKTVNSSLYGTHSFIYLKSPFKNSVSPVTTCKDPPALSSIVLLPSSNVTWISDCASAGTSLAVEEQHLIQLQKGLKLSLTLPGWITYALHGQCRTASDPLLPPLSHTRTEAELPAWAARAQSASMWPLAAL